MGEAWILIPLAAIGLPMLIGLTAVVLEHREKMAAKRLSASKDEEAAKAALDKATSDYQEFVLGVDARLQRLEDRIAKLESRARQTGESGDTQQVRRT